MFESEVLSLIASLFGCWLLGWSSAYVVHIVKIFVEKI